MNQNIRFDPAEKEQQLRSESTSWDVSAVQAAREGDIPVIDISDYLHHEDQDKLDHIANKLRNACLKSGFYCITGHQIPESVIGETFDAVRRFHKLPDNIKNHLLMDRAGTPVKGAGYLPVKNRKLPTRDKGNLNEAFIIKRDHDIGFSDNQWPEESQLPGFRKQIEQYATAIEDLALKLLPIYARALHLDKNFFIPGFTDPFYRLRMTHYPVISKTDENEFGIAPHVDTTFFTLLAQDSEGLIIYNEQRACWIKAPVIPNAFIVNTGELLKQWSNDLFISVKHFANNNTSNQSRYSIPFFFNANSDYKMACLPTCHNETNPPKYPTISYRESQAVAQGE